jgi:hypothetical protein
MAASPGDARRIAQVMRERYHGVAQVAGLPVEVTGL